MAKVKKASRPRAMTVRQAMAKLAKMPPTSILVIADAGYYLPARFEQGLYRYPEMGSMEGMDGDRIDPQNKQRGDRPAVFLC